MYSCVFWCGFIHLVGFLAVILCDPCHSLQNTKERQHRKKQPAVRPDLVYLKVSKAVSGPKTHRIAYFLDKRQSSIRSLHRSKRSKAK